MIEITLSEGDRIAIAAKNNGLDGETLMLSPLSDEGHVLVCKDKSILKLG